MLEHAFGEKGTRRRRDYSEAMRRFEEAARAADRSGTEVLLQVRFLPQLAERPRDTGAIQTSAFAPLAL